MAPREIDLTQKTHQDRDKRDRIERLKVRVKEAQSWLATKNAILGILDLLADEL